MNKSWYQSLWYWRLAIFECVTDAFIAGAMVWIAAVAQNDWSQLSKTAREVIVVSTVVAMLKVIKSVLSNTITVLQDNMPLAPGVTQRQEVKETTKTVVEVPPASPIIPPTAQVNEQPKQT